MKLLSKLRVISKKNKLFHSVLRRIHIIIVFFINFPKTINMMFKERYKLQVFSTINNVNWFINVPSHSNLGDQAMSLSIRRWLVENYSNRIIYEISRPVLTWNFIRFINKWQKLIKEDDIIFIQGGYTSSDKTPNEKVHRKIAQSFPNNRIVFFPQTASYEDLEELKKTANIYNMHGHILFLARDEVSYNHVLSYFTEIKVLLFPDIATSLIGRYVLPMHEKKGVLLCIREDSEKRYSHKQINDLENKLSEKYILEKQDLIIKNHDYDAVDFERIIKEVLIIFASHKVIVTDRFHGVIFSMIAGSKVIALDSIDYKVREGSKMMDMYFNNSAFYAESFNETFDLVDYAMREPDIPKNDVLHKRFYSKLKILIEEL